MGAGQEQSRPPSGKLGCCFPHRAGHREFLSERAFPKKVGGKADGEGDEVAHRATPGLRGLTTSLLPVYHVGSSRRVLAVRSTFNPNLASRTAVLLTCEEVARFPPG